MLSDQMTAERHPLFDPDFIATVITTRYQSGAIHQRVEIRYTASTRKALGNEIFAQFNYHDGPTKAIKRLASTVTGRPMSCIIVEKLNSDYYTVHVF